MFQLKVRSYSISPFKWAWCEAFSVDGGKRTLKDEEAFLQFLAVAGWVHVLDFCPSQGAPKLRVSQQPCSLHLAIICPQPSQSTNWTPKVCHLHHRQTASEQHTCPKSSSICQCPRRSLSHTSTLITSTGPNTSPPVIWRIHTDLLLSLQAHWKSWVQPTCCLEGSHPFCTYKSLIQVTVADHLPAGSPEHWVAYYLSRNCRQAWAYLNWPISLLSRGLNCTLSQEEFQTPSKCFLLWVLSFKP